jgi:hypothetical protein
MNSVNAQALYDYIKKSLTRGLRNIVVMEPKTAAVHARMVVQNILEHIKDSGTINAWKIDSVTAEALKSIYNDVKLPLDAVPGDAVYSDDGEYEGVIVSVTEPGKGRVLWNEPDAGGSMIRCKASIAPAIPAEYIVIDVKV